LHDMAEIDGFQQIKQKGYAIFRDIIDSKHFEFVLPFIFDNFIEDHPDSIWQTEWTTHPNLLFFRDLPSIQSLLKSLLGECFVLPEKVQVAVVYPQTNVPPDSEVKKPPGTHFDGMFTDGECGDEMSLHHFSILLGIILTGSDAPLRGNFGVAPGSHLLLEKKFKKLSRIKSEDKSEEDLAEELLSLTHSVVRDSLLQLEPFEYVVGSPGDVFIAHYQTLHATCANLGNEPRVCLYFRVHSTLEQDYQSDLRNLFNRIPCLSSQNGN